MFDPPQGTLDHQREHETAACWRELGEIAARRARDDQRETVLVREADDRGDWKRAGFASSAEWLAQATHSEYRTAARTGKIADKLRVLPALDEALRRGELTLDQVGAGTPFATPETDAQLARLAIGKAPGEIARLARELAPPTVADDGELRRRRALRMKWIEGGRELEFKGQLPLEQGLAFEQAIRSAASTQRATDKKTGQTTLEWQQYTADALVTLTTRDSASEAGGIRRSNTTVILHLSADEPPFIEGAGTVSPETAEYLACDARRMTIKPHGRDLVHSRLARCATYAQIRALVKRDKHCRYLGCTSVYELEAHHLVHAANGGETLTADMFLLCSRHHKHLHDHHIETTGTGAKPIFKDQAGRLITTNRPHAPPR